MFTEVIECPQCGKPNNALEVTDGGAVAPSNGDISACSHCGTMSIFCVHGDGGTHLRMPRNAGEYAHVWETMSAAFGPSGS